MDDHPLRNLLKRVHFKATKKLNIGITTQLTFCLQLPLVGISRGNHLIRVNNTAVNRKGAEYARKKISSNRLGASMSLDFVDHHLMPPNVNLSKISNVS